MTRKDKTEKKEKKLPTPKNKKVIADYLPRLKKMYQAGFSDTEIMETLELDKTEFYELKIRVRGGKAMIERWKQERIDNVTNALYELALGRFVDIEQQKPMTLKFGDSTALEIAHYTERKYLQPDFNAIKFYLLNHAPSVYKDRSELHLAQVENLSTEEIEQMVLEQLRLEKQDIQGDSRDELQD